ncbi:MAG: tRNA (N6-isopentenyl adenosine(37)-C2)-methylthiotransferase MiaB [Candidatus Omnitrophica bacterium]|nr:tRNA (N6-isopentenyl adenosine(37)-C2)-methylthiotransferase MiaB [Candidatus Omnitrophota bacterium]
MNQRDKKTVFIRSFGCQMNEYDSEQVTRVLSKRGYTFVSDSSQADIILFNTCAVRRHAEDRVYGQLRMLRSAKKKNKHLIIGLMGCMANAYKDMLLQQYSYLDFISGTKDFTRLPEIINEVIGQRTQKAFISDLHDEFIYSKNFQNATKVNAFVPIMRGCDNYCSYCIVPYVRGNEISRSPQEIKDEISFLARKGVKEITLLGQNVNSYGKGLQPTIDFSTLLEQVSIIKSIEVIRFMTSHPKDVSEKLFSVMRDNKKVEKHIHLPLQSGSDKILQLMNRNYSIDKYRHEIEALRKQIPDVSVTTDIIVGFCQEGEKEFKETKMVMKDIEFDGAFIFKYSPREKTKAYDLPDTVAHNVKHERNNELLNLQSKISDKKNRSYIGRTEKILIAAVSKKSQKQVRGRTWSDKEVVCDGSSDLIGKVVTVELKGLSHETFKGQITD